MESKSGFHSGKAFEFDASLAREPAFREPYREVLSVTEDWWPGRPFPSPGWKTIAIPLDIGNTNLAPHRLTGKPEIDFGYDLLHRDWLATFLGTFGAGGGELITVLNFAMGHVARCAADPEIIREIVGYEFFGLNNTYIVGETRKWGLMQWEDGLTYIGAQRPLIDRLCEILGGENILEYFLAIGMNYKRVLFNGNIIREYYDVTDWIMPFETGEGESGMPREQIDAEIDKTENLLRTRFGIGPDRTLKP